MSSYCQQYRARNPHGYRCHANTCVKFPATAQTGGGRRIYGGRVITSGLVNLYTRDIATGMAFYRDLLGLRETFRTPTNGTPEHVEMAAGGFTLALGTVEAAKRVHGVDSTPGMPAMVVVLWTEDVDATYATLVAAGAPGVTEPHDAGNGNRNALVRDPDGNLVELVAKRS